ncbi:MAG: tRNA (adenosine(37)-N6)-threonylcarbamoyltransferase complex ATPase subunit type 1 TsaE [Clostridia bacterium]|nr:tRNA (adenosine(37)-N6)-threonylcarbamoyltransferase complex ATPase subunit type 1 TsaE [Clostridia bacterium]
MTITTHSAAETEAFAAQLAAQLKPGTVVAFFGGLGRGKTAFVRGLAATLCPEAQVSSPTFSLVNVYGGDPPLVHFDMYRVSGWDDLYTTGFFEYQEQGCILAVEWSENIEGALPPDAVRITIDRVDETTRRITVEESMA